MAAHPRHLRIRASVPIVVRGLLLLACLGGWMAALPAAAQIPGPSADEARDTRVRRLRLQTWEMHAERLDYELRVDGRLDEEAWTRAVPASDFYQGERHEGVPATERTEVRVLYDRTHLYIGIRCLDHEPSKIRARGIFRDEQAGSDDLLLVMIDAFHDHRTAMQFVTNANGLVQDAMQLGETTATRNENYDAVWTAKGGRTAEGFEVEMVIPFTSLRFRTPPSGEEVVFGIGFKRNIPRKNEDVTWPFVSNDSSWYRPAELGHLRGLRYVESGRNVEVRPYALGGATTDLLTGSDIPRREAGLDLRWGLTSGLTADFTVNTDFAQEEADVQQLNFTRFSLFFPEKRQLFLEGEQMFRFGLPAEADLVFTRRIGLSHAGEIVPILGGARLSGREGRTTIGAMSMQTGRSGDLAAENFTVFRVGRDMLRRLRVGALFTSRQGGGQANRVLGVDGNLYVRDVWFFEGFLARSQDSGVGDGLAASGRASLDMDRFGASYRYLGIDASFRSGVGFVQRPDSRQHAAEVRYSPRPRSDLVRQFHFKALFSSVTDSRGRVETQSRAGEAAANLESGDVVTFRVSNGLESIASPFLLQAGLEVPPGTYRSDTYAASLKSYSRRPLKITLMAETGGFWGGSRHAVSVRWEHRLATHLGLLLSADRNWVSLPQGRFDTTLVSGKIQIVLRKDMGLWPLLQYNQVTGQLSTNVRFNWIPKPGTDLFVVFNELDAWHGLLQPKTRSLVVKLNYLFAL